MMLWFLLFSRLSFLSLRQGIPRLRKLYIGTLTTKQEFRIDHLNLCLSTRRGWPLRSNLSTDDPRLKMGLCPNGTIVSR